MRPAGRVSGWLEDRLPPSLQGRVRIEAGHLALLTTVAAVAMGLLAWSVVRSSDPGDLAPARTAVDGRAPLTALATPASAGGPGSGEVLGGPGPADGADEVVVDVAGKVRRPGIVRLPAGSRVVEIGCVELVNRFLTGRTFHCYINPERDMPAEAFAVHGLSSEFLSSKPRFTEVVEEFLEFIGDAPLVSDASSDIFSGPIDITRYGLVYAGAQKNLGPSGVTVVIIRQDLLERSGKSLHTMLNYAVHAENGSLYNTPPAFGVYVLGLVLLAAGAASAEQMAAADPSSERRYERGDDDHRCGRRDRGVLRAAVPHARGLRHRVRPAQFAVCAPQPNVVQLLRPAPVRAAHLAGELTL